jgi:hypothetical protein
MVTVSRMLVQVLFINPCVCAKRQISRSYQAPVFVCRFLSPLLLINQNTHAATGCGMLKSSQLVGLPIIPRLVCFGVGLSYANPASPPLAPFTVLTAPVNHYSNGAAFVPCLSGTSSTNKGAVTELYEGVCSIGTSYFRGVGDEYAPGICRPCKAGSRSASKFDSERAISTLCERGSFQPLKWQVARVLCPSGRVAPDRGAEQCAPCGDGESTRGLTGALKCQACQTGTFSFRQLDGGVECLPCADGTFTDKFGTAGARAACARHSAQHRAIARRATASTARTPSRLPICGVSTVDQMRLLPLLCQCLRRARKQSCVCLVQRTQFVRV